MFNLSSLLEKFKYLKDPKENKTIVIRIVSEIAGVTIIEREISMQKNTIYLGASALAKSRIFMNKESILQKITEELPDLYIKEII